MPPEEPTYRGSNKHKNRPARGPKGTLCPEWTHATTSGGYETDPHEHEWKETFAAQLFSNATVDQETGRRYATARGVAFEARSTNDGTWHGFPIPWESVPSWVTDTWLSNGDVTSRQVSRFLAFDRDNIRWALETDN